MTNTIPEGYYVFPFNASILNYASEGVAQNIIALRIDNLNGGHYVVSTDMQIILHAKHIQLSVVASNQSEANSLVQQLSGTVANLNDFCVCPQDIAFSNLLPREGDNVTLTAKIFNFGTIGMTCVPIDLYIDSTKIVTAAIPVIQAFANQTVNFNWTATRGTHYVTIVVNGYQIIPESDYSNNQAQTSITVLVDDVAVTNVSPVGSYIQQGSAIPIIVTAANRGDFTETFNVTVYANSTSIGWQTITLTSGASTTITFTWITTISNLGNYTMSAYAAPVAGEIETADNTFVYGTLQIVQATTGGGGSRMPYTN